MTITTELAQLRTGKPYVIIYRDNYDGERNVYPMIAIPDANGDWWPHEGGDRLMQYQGDEILKIWAIDELEAKDKQIAELTVVNAAAEKLVRCKGRYHSELNYRALAALFGVTAPDLPPMDHENVHYADAAEMEIATLRQRIAELELQLIAPLSIGELLQRLKDQTGEEYVSSREARTEQQPVAWAYKENVWATGLCGYVWRDKIEEEYPGGESEHIKDVTALYTSTPAPAPVTVKRLPKRSVGEVMHMSGFSRDYAEGWCAGNDNARNEIQAAGIKIAEG